MTKLDSIFKSRDITLPTKVRLVKAMVYPVVMYGCESWTIKKTESEIHSVVSDFLWPHELYSPWKESWVPKNWCSWTVVLEKSLESPLDSMEIQPVHPKGNQFWILIGRTDAEAETPILWLPDEKNWLIWKDSDAGKDWRQEEMGTTEDRMVGWHYRLNGHEFE